MIQVCPVATDFCNRTHQPEKNIELVRRLVHKYAAALGVPLSAPRIRPVIRFIAPTVLNEDTQRGLADLAFINGALHALDRLVEPPLANHAECDAAFACRSQHCITVREARGERFLDQHMNARLRGTDRGCGMKWMRCADNDGFRRCFAEHHVEIGKGPNTMLGSESFSSLGANVARCDEFGFGK